MNQAEPPTCFRLDLFTAWLVLVLASGGCSDAARPGFKANPPVSSVIRASADDVVPQICEPYKIQITGSRDGWHVRYPGAEGRLESEGDALAVRNIHVPLRVNVVLVLKSTDYVYVLAIPEYGLKEIAVPELEFRMEFRPKEAGRFELVGNELCGDPHTELQGFLIVEPEERFRDWLKTAGPEGAD